MTANIASALRNVPHLAALVQAVAEEVAAGEVAPLLPYLIDEVPASALYHLAEQFNVLGWRGWRLADTEQQRRDIVKQAISLQRRKGTPSAVKDAVRTLGFGEVTIKEGIGAQYDGTYIHDGSITYSPEGWAFFRVAVLVEPGIEISEVTVFRLTNLINEYKNARSVLRDITFRIAIQDNNPLLDYVQNDDEGITDSISQGVKYDGREDHDGSAVYGEGPDTVEVRIFRSGKLTDE